MNCCECRLIYSGSDPKYLKHAKKITVYINQKEKSTNCYHFRGTFNCIYCSVQLKTKRSKIFGYFSHFFSILLGSGTNNSVFGFPTPISSLTWVILWCGCAAAAAAPGPLSCIEAASAAANASSSVIPFIRVAAAAALGADELLVPDDVLARKKLVILDCWPLGAAETVAGALPLLLIPAKCSRRFLLTAWGPSQAWS